MRGGGAALTGCSSRSSFEDIDQDKINGTVCAAAADVLSQSVRFNLIAASESFVSV